MSNKLTGTPQWKWMMMKQKGMTESAPREMYYTGEEFTVPKDKFVEVDGEFRATPDFPQEMRGKKFRVIGIGDPPNKTLLYALTQRKLEEQNKPRNLDPGPKEKIDCSHWKAGHWKVAKLILRRDMDRADNHWMRFGTKSAYRQYKLIEQFLEEKSQQNWDPDDDFSTKYLVKYRRAFSDSMNTRLDWDVRRDALNTLDEVRDKLKIPTYNKL